jgi:glyoxylase-like metal-dependent hydrolase (beta-lactamase superfamily II)
MVDTGLIIAGSFRDLDEKAAADGVDLRETRAVLHTHSHWDHITGDCIVQREYGAKVHAHPLEKPIIESQEAGFRAMLLDTGEFYSEIFGLPPFVYKVLLRYLGGSYNDLRVDHELSGGERLDFGFVVSPIHTPGHSPGHMVYYFPETKTLAGGDLLDLETGTCVDFNNPHSDYADGLASLEQVRAMDVEIYLPSHGEPVIGKQNVEHLLDKMLANTRAFPGEILQALSRRQGTLTEIFNDLMPGLPFTLKAMKMMQVLTGLKHLREEKKVVLEKQEKKLVWRLA